MLAVQLALVVLLVLVADERPEYSLGAWDLFRLETALESALRRVRLARSQSGRCSRSDDSAVVRNARGLLVLAFQLTRRV